MPRKASLVTVLLFLGLVGCDHATKHQAAASLGDGRVQPVVGGVLELRYAENEGIGFNLERVLPEPARLPVIFIVDGAITLLILALWYRRRGPLSAETAAYAILAAGAAGNLIDRIARGFVVDFIHLRGWPIFNVADMCLVAGVVLLLLDAWRQRPTTAR